MKVRTTIFTLGLALLLIGPGAQAAIITTGNVDPADLSTWDETTVAHVGQSDDGTITLDLSDGNADEIISYYAYIGTNSSVTGEATINGADSLWTVQKNIYVGNAGIGILNVENGGQVTYNGTLDVGSGSSAEGTIVVTGSGSRLEDLTPSDAIDQRLIIGDNGTGRMEILDGATVSSSYIDYIGLNAGASGSVLVDGSDSLYTSPHTINVGNRAGSTGELTVQNGATVNANSWVTIGDDANGTGTVTVTGAGSELIGGGVVYVGYEGDGTLYIEDGGKATTENGLCGWGGGTGEIHFSNGTLDAMNFVGGSADIFGTGTINTNGMVTDADIVLNNPAALTQTITGFGVDSGVTINLDVNGSAWLMGAGETGKGSIIISNGVAIYVGQGHLGRGTGGVGTGVITGTGSTWEADYFLAGRAGVAILDICDGGLLKVNSGLFIARDTPGSTINMSDGGMISLFSDANEDEVGDNLSGSIAAFLAAVQGSGSIQWWDSLLGSWEDLSTATLGIDCTLEYLTSGDMTGYTLLTVLADGPPPGDANSDGVVDNQDAALLAANWLTMSGATWGMGDFNRDGAVDDKDSTILAANWQTGSTSASVPEPAVITLLCLGALLLLNTRKRSA